MSKKYRVLHGIDTLTKAGKPKRFEPGTVTDDLPTDAIRWLLDQKHIEEVGDDPVEAKERTKEVKAVAGPPEDKAERMALDKQELLSPEVAREEGE